MNNKLRLVLIAVASLTVAGKAAQQWSQEGTSHAVLDEAGGCWLTREGIDEARKRLKWKAVTKFQLAKDKDAEAARKFTYRYRKNGSTPEDAIRAFLSDDKT